MHVGGGSCCLGGGEASGCLAPGGRRQVDGGADFSGQDDVHGQCFGPCGRAACAARVARAVNVAQPQGAPVRAGHEGQAPGSAHEVGAGGRAVCAGEWLALSSCCRIKMLRPAGGEQEGVLHHEAGQGGDVDGGFLDESAGVQVGPGVEGGFGLRALGPVDLGAVPALGVAEVVLCRLCLSDGQDVVGDVEQGGVGDGLGVEVLQLLGVGDVEALQAALNGGPDAVAGLGVGIDAKHGVDTGAVVCRSRAQGRKRQGEPDRAGQDIPARAAVFAKPAGEPGEHGCADRIAGRHSSGQRTVLEIAVHAEKSVGCALRRRDRHFGMRSTVAPSVSFQKVCLDAGRARPVRSQAPARASEAGRLHSGCVEQTPQSQSRTEQNAVTA